MFKLFGFANFWLLAYPRTFMVETCRVH